MREVDLPLSKSVVARVAMMAAVSGGKMPDGGGSEDGEMIVKALGSDEERVYVGSSGTAARFVIAFYGSRSVVRVVDGSEQLRRRPVGAVVEAMRRLGAEIEYVGEEGRLPVRIEGCSEVGQEVEADAGESSQTISALMLIGAERGIRIEMKGDMVSSTYIELTRRLMENAGVRVRMEGNVIEVLRGEYSVGGEMDRDWSSAVFWYGMVAVGEESDVMLKGLRMRSGQPDERVVEVYERLGVKSRETPKGVMIYREEMSMNRTFALTGRNDDANYPGRCPGLCTDCPFRASVLPDSVDGMKCGDCGFVEECCEGCPDMVPVLVGTLCRMGLRFRITGLETLERKESRRGTVMVREMRKLGYCVEFDGESMWWNGERCKVGGTADTSDDHRIAMALIVAGAETKDIECIKKSYRGFAGEIMRK